MIRIRDSRLLLVLSVIFFSYLCFFFNDTATTEIYTLSLHDALPICDVVVEVENLSKSYGDNLLFENLSFSLPKGGIVGVIGPNGAGKSTLFKMIAGQVTQDSGTLVLGDTVKLGYVDQNRQIDDSLNVWECISDGQEVVMLGKI